MSNEQKLREALRETLLFCETFSNRWDGETGAHPFGMVERARQALATTEPEPTGMPELPEPDEMEVRWLSSHVYTEDQMQTYGKQCWKAGCKHGAWGDKPAVNQQLTTEPIDEREAFEREMSKPPFEFCMDRWPDDGSYAWPGNYAAYHTQCAWVAWQARAAMTQVGDINVVESFTNDTKDAERYRWLADSNNYYEAINLISDRSLTLTEDALGKAIDAAMAQEVKG